MTLDLNREESEVLAGFDGKWRRNLRLAERGNLTVRQWTDPSVDEIVSAYAAMQSLKGLEEQFSREEFASVLKTLKQQLIIYRGEDEEGKLVSLRGWLVLGNRANELLAATTERGREMRASYAVTWALLRHCRRLQIQACDLGGIEPIVNPGVYRFKRGTGATPIEYLGEWDWGSRPWLQWFGNWAISRRQRLRAAEAALKSSARSDDSKRVLDHRSPAELSHPGIA
jgi:lipid II:glycine glycyltransferase (peptidoglycan interpeptide bridge formation enzyme)